MVRSAGMTSSGVRLSDLFFLMKAHVAALVAPINAATWAFIRKNKSLNLTPELVMPAERTIFQQLNSDPAVHVDHRHYRLWMNGDGTTTAEWITVGPLDTSVGWKQIKAWEVSPDATNALFADHDYGYFNGQWKLTPTQPIYRLEELPALN